MLRRTWAGVLAVVVMSASGCTYECHYDVLSRTPSPDGRQDVVTYVSSCGAMVSSRWGVALVPVSAKMTTDNQARILHYADSIRAPGGLRPATATWRPDGTLEVSYDARADVIMKMTVMSRIPVVYHVD